MTATQRLTPKQRLIRIINRLWFWLGLPELMRPYVPPKAGPFRGGSWPDPKDIASDVYQITPEGAFWRGLDGR